MAAFGNNAGVCRNFAENHLHISWTKMLCFSAVPVHSLQ